MGIPEKFFELRLSPETLTDPELDIEKLRREKREYLERLMAMPEEERRREARWMLGDYLNIVGIGADLSDLDTDEGIARFWWNVENKSPGYRFTPIPDQYSDTMSNNPKFEMFQLAIPEILEELNTIMEEVNQAIEERDLETFRDRISRAYRIVTGRE